MQEHYFSKEPASELKLGLLQIANLRGLNLELYTASGLFAYKKIDKGTWVLIENMIIQGRKILDLGCGIGVIGITYAILDKTANITCSDINNRAVKIAGMNADKLGLKLEIVQSDLFENLKGNFDNILSNPPITAGMETCYKLVEDSHKHLNEKGLLQVIARHKHGGERIMKKMQETFKNCRVICKRGGYWLYVSERLD